jgi:hypothetical protein
MLAGYYHKVGGLGLEAAQTKAASVAGLWSFSLMATYETIDAVLDQHKKAQVAVTSATMAHIMYGCTQMINDSFSPVVPSEELHVVFAMCRQALYSYFDQMAKISSGLLPAYYDVMSVGHPYKDTKDHFSAIRDEMGVIVWLYSMSSKQWGDSE